MAKYMCDYCRQMLSDSKPSLWTYDVAQSVINAQNRFFPAMQQNSYEGLREVLGDENAQFLLQNARSTVLLSLDRKP